jgi:hypothetical protein
MSTTQSVHGAVTGPAANAALAQLTGLAAGRYSVEVSAYFSGTVTAAEADNVQLLVDGTQTDILAIPPAAATTGAIAQFSFEHLTTTGAIALEAIANAGASAVYHVLLVVAKLPAYNAD